MKKPFKVFSPFKLGAIIRAINSIWSPKAFFVNNEQGAWYDPSDLTTLFQDAAGTTPVTAVEQPVGLMLDKSKGLVLGSELVSNGTFDSGIAGWTNLNNSRSTVSWNSSNKRLKNDNTTGTGDGYVWTATAVTTNRWCKISGNIYDISGSSSSIKFYWWDGSAGIGIALTTPVVSNSFSAILSVPSTAIGILVGSTNTTGVWELDNISVRELPGNHAFQTTSANRPVLSARVNQFVSSETLATQTVTTRATTQTLRFGGTGSITLSGTATGAYTAGTYTFTTTAGTLTATVSGTVTQADLRESNTGVGLPAYQRVNTSTDYDTTGFKPYLSFNGVNQWLQTNSIDFTYGDKMFVCAGVRKLSDAAGAIVAELSNSVSSNNGAFYVAAPNGPGTSAAMNAKGTVSVTAGDGSFASPITGVLSGAADIAGGVVLFRTNGVTKQTSSSTLGTGNFGSYPLYLFARAGTSLFFNGQFYGAIIRGAQSSAAEITNAETWMNQRTRAWS